MESDDDFQLYSPAKESSSPVPERKFKRLKKAKAIVESSSKVEGQYFEKSNSQDLEESNLGSRSGSDGFEEENELDYGFDGFLSVEEDGSAVNRALEFDSVAEEFDGKGEDRMEDVETEEERRDLRTEGVPAKRALEFDFVEKEFDGKGEDPMEDVEAEEERNDLRTEGAAAKRAFEFDSDQMKDVETEEERKDLRTEESKKKRRNLDGSEQKKEENKKKKGVKSVGDDDKPKSAASTKRRAEKERREHLKQLHAESQRLLRETRDAAFKPVPLVQKPISSVLAKIRQRKLEVSKKSVVLSRTSWIDNNDGFSREIMADLDSENALVEEIKDDKVAKVASEETVDFPADEESNLDTSRADLDSEKTPVEEIKDDKVVKVASEETIACPADVESNLDASCADGNAAHSSHKDIPSQMVLDEESKLTFRAPIDDTQDLFSDSQTSDSKDELQDETPGSPLEEDLAPSLLAMKLKFDSAPPDGNSSDEDDNDKENIDPHQHQSIDLSSSPNGDPVKAFVDDEAEEEDDSDNDLFRFQDNEEEEENEDAEELMNLIATGYEEKPIDTEKRNELHQKWLEQQDAAGTENLLQRLKCGLKQKEPTLLEEEETEEGEEDKEEFGDGNSEDLLPANVVRMNIKKAKQMIPLMFTDKDDAYISSDDEETEKRLVKQCLFEKAVEQATFLSPAENKESREAFGRIKKLNNFPDNRKKVKTSTLFDTLLVGGNRNLSTKSSFLGRVSNHSLPSSRKNGSSKVCSFIFERDDSHRSSTSVSGDSSDLIHRENQLTKTSSAKFSNSQSKSSAQSTKAAPASETNSGTTLFKILKHSSLQAGHCSQDSMVGHTESVLAAFKVEKKPIKKEPNVSIRTI